MTDTTTDLDNLEGDLLVGIDLGVPGDDYAAAIFRKGNKIVATTNDPFIIEYIANLEKRASQADADAEGAAYAMNNAITARDSTQQARIAEMEQVRQENFDDALAGINEINNLKIEKAALTEKMDALKRPVYVMHCFMFLVLKAYRDLVSDLENETISESLRRAIWVKAELIGGYIEDSPVQLKTLPDKEESTMLELQRISKEG